MKNDEHKGLRSGAACLSLCLLVASGCTSGSADADNGLSTHDKPPRESKIDRVEQENGRPAAVVTRDGRRVEFENGEATVGDTIAIATTGGEVEYHRAPSAIMAELSRIQVAYRVEDSEELVYFDGLAGNPRVDPNSGKLCWMAVTCKNPDCPENKSPDRPHVFSFEEPGYSVDASGKIVKPDARTAALRPSTTLPCPSCNNRDFLEPYRPIEVFQRRAELEAELAASRAARARRARP